MAYNADTRAVGISEQRVVTLFYNHAGVSVARIDLELGKFQVSWVWNALTHNANKAGIVKDGP